VNETNRTVIVLLAAAAIVLMAVVIFVTWAAPEDAADRVQDLGEFLVAHQDSDASRLILTLGALVVVILALLTIIVELAPAEETHDLRVKQAGTTTILPAQALQQRLEEALLALPMIAAAQARVSGGDRGISTTLELTIFPDANLASATQDASRIVVDTLQTDLGLPVAGPPTVRIAFGEAKAVVEAPTASSSVMQPPIEPDAAPASPAAYERASAIPDAAPTETPVPPGGDQPAEPPIDQP